MRGWGSARTAVILLAFFLPIQTVRADDDGVSIVHLAFRDHIVTITSSPRGSLFSVRTSSGELADANLTEEELLAGYPELYAHLRSLYASDAAGDLIWAGRSSDDALR